MSIKVRQRDITDCGAACLASVAAHHKLNLPVSKIRQWAGTDKKGTNAWGLIKAAEKMGMTAKGVKATPEALSEIPLPAIAHVIVKEKLQHYVVIYKVTPTYVEIMDPGNCWLFHCTLGFILLLTTLIKSANVKLWSRLLNWNPSW